MADEKTLPKKTGSVKDLEGIIRRPPGAKPVSIEEMNEAVIAEAVARDKRSKRN